MSVLIVDNDPAVIQSISEILNDYDLLFVTDFFKAKEIIRKTSGIDLVLCNRENVDCDQIDMGLVSLDFFYIPLNSTDLRKRIELHCDLAHARWRLEQQGQNINALIQESTREHILARDITIHALVSLLEIRNIESSKHTLRAQMMMQALGEQLKTLDEYRELMTPGLLAELFDTVPLHDIGKVGIPDNILLKPGKLTEDEFEIIKKHTTMGVAAFKEGCAGKKSPSFIMTALDIIGTHHEKFDGTGYPAGLKGQAIPLAGRMMAIIDVYDALVNQRVYKTAFPHEMAIQIINKESGLHFDPVIVGAFMGIVSQMQAIQSQFAQP